MILKKLRQPAIITAVLMLTSFYQLKGQILELSPFIGYETSGRLWTTKGYLRVGDGMDYGGSLDFRFAYGSQFEFSYSHMMSTLTLDEGFVSNKLCDLAVDYFSFGGLKELNTGETVVPYGLASLGWVNYRPSDTYHNENMMHISIAGGVKVYATNRIGLRLQARLLMPIWYSGLYFSGGTGGAGLGLSATAAAVQGDFTAALIFVIK